jgi:hypothetical protein
VPLYTLETFAHNLLADEDPGVHEKLNSWVGPIKQIIVLEVKKNLQNHLHYYTLENPKMSRISISYAEAG